MTDHDRISPYNVSTMSSSQVRKKCQLGDYYLIQYQILQTNIMRTVWWTVRRITNEILGVKGLMIYHNELEDWPIFLFRQPFNPYK